MAPPEKTLGSGNKITSGKKTFKNKINTNINNIKWNHNDSKNYLTFFSKNIFRKPDNIDKNSRGIAIWYPKNNEKINLNGNNLPNIFSEHWCRDESIPHKCPKPHNDFFYSFITIDLDNTIWYDILAVSGSVGYDPLKKLLYARCGSIEANIATLYTCLLINQKKLTIKEVQQNKIYSKNISSTSDINNVLNMYTYLLKNLKQNIPKTGYWDIAFPKYGKTKKC